MCHDLDHDGRNNAFHNASNSQIAIRYSYQSTLERHHLATCFGILCKADCNVLSNLNDGQKATVRSKLVSLILATDFSEHFQILKDYDDFIAEVPPEKLKDVGAMEPEDKMLVLKV